ncbi:hypothetical protein [Facklamia sp. 7083-14-GEN3]|uniref:hypothetical protein n=1 Tax=Facklamia sp. 7083-14-GEN3 TaxID=2973478 RepID=UPI00215BBD76|nr:hypothetical protein [Facklamia sp. 7083-14-GEN3]MCR8969806.1 hypothetical protein [Facklamia sp. 7083-14-GEN3]
MHIRIKRNEKFVGSLWPLFIYQDGKAIGKIASGETKLFEVQEGSTLIVKLGNQLGSIRSNPIEVEEGDYLEVSDKPWLEFIQFILFISIPFSKLIPGRKLSLLALFLIAIAYLATRFLIENYTLEKKN